MEKESFARFLDASWQVPVLGACKTGKFFGSVRNGGNVSRSSKWSMTWMNVCMNYMTTQRHTDMFIYHIHIYIYSYLHVYIFRYTYTIYIYIFAYIYIFTFIYTYFYIYIYSDVSKAVSLQKQNPKQKKLLNLVFVPLKDKHLWGFRDGFRIWVQQQWYCHGLYRVSSCCFLMRNRKHHAMAQKRYLNVQSKSVWLLYTTSSWFQLVIVIIFTKRL